MPGKTPLDGMLLLTAQTPLRPGAGSGHDVIDNPVIRERSTQFPFIQSSSLKGVLKTAACEIWQGDDGPGKVAAVFGPERDKAEKHEASFSPQEARIFAMPVKSLKGLFVWVTCPLVLSRFIRELSKIGRHIKDGNRNVDLNKWLNGLDVQENAGIIVTDGVSQIVYDEKISLEEYELEVSTDTTIQLIANQLADRFFTIEYLKKMFKTRLAILHDDLFRHFAVKSTEIQANIAINQDTGTTVKGSLRYTEYLPEETLLFSSYRIGKNYSDYQELDLKKTIRELLAQVAVIQIGGNETIGKGIVHLNNWEAKS